MKEWWLNLALREKQMVALGGLFIILFLIYLLLWSPLQTKIENLRTQIIKDKKLLVWMHETDQQIQTIEKNAKKPIPAANTGSILSIVQHQLNNSPLVSSLGELKQAENDSVQMSFNNVEFDKLIAWLTQLWQQEGLTIAQMSVAASTTPGLVTVEMVLKR